MFRFCDQPRNWDAKRRRDSDEILEADVPLATFDGTHVRAVNADDFGERFLAEAILQAAFADGKSDVRLQLI